MAEGPFGCAQSVLLRGNAVLSHPIGERNLCLRRQRLAEAFVRTLVGTREESPGVGEALHRRGDDAQTHQNQQGHKPARVEDVGQAGDIEKAQHGRGVSALHVVGFGHGPLQNDGACRGKDDHQNNQNDPGLDGTECLPNAAARRAK